LVLDPAASESTDTVPGSPSHEFKVTDPEKCEQKKDANGTKQHSTMLGKQKACEENQSGGTASGSDRMKERREQREVSRLLKAEAFKRVESAHMEAIDGKKRKRQRIEPATPTQTASAEVAGHNRNEGNQPKTTASAVVDGYAFK
jgi:hypothetical protein